MKSTRLIAFAVLMCWAVAHAGDKESTKVSLPFASVEGTTEYSGSKKEYEEAVNRKERAIRSGDGAAMINETEQPTRERSVRTEIGGDVRGFGGARSSERSLGKTSAAEEALSRTRP